MTSSRLLDSSGTGNGLASINYEGELVDREPGLSKLGWRAPYPKHTCTSPNTPNTVENPATCNQSKHRTRAHHYFLGDLIS